jgi:hypothetical protein
MYLGHKQLIILAFLSVGVVVVVSRRNYEHEPPPPPLTKEEKQVMTRQLTVKALSGTAVETQRATSKLAAMGEAGKPHLRKVLTQSGDPSSKAIAIAGLASLWDYPSMDGMVRALEDSSPLVRARAGAAVQKMLGANHHYRPNDPEDQRAHAIDLIKADWEHLRNAEFFDKTTAHLQPPESLR